MDFQFLYAYASAFFRVVILHSISLSLSCVRQAGAVLPLVCPRIELHMCIYARRVLPPAARSGADYPIIYFEFASKWM